MTYPIYVLRHGETDWNATGRLQGHFDSSLTATGRAQAAAQHEILSECDLKGFRAITSPQGRAFQTAAIALNGLIGEIETDARLREIGIGDWAGQERDTLLAQTGAADGFSLYELAPGGEGFSALRNRCTDFLDRLPGPTVIVTHGITSRMLRLVALDKPTSELRNVGGGQGVVFSIANGQQQLLTKGA